MISGDQTACAEATALLGDIETAVVKRATGRNSAECLPPEVTTQLIRDAAERGVRQLEYDAAPTPRRLSPPITVAVEFIRSEMADAAGILPGEEQEGASVAYTAEDMPTAYRAFRSLVGLANRLTARRLRYRSRTRGLRPKVAA